MWTNTPNDGLREGWRFIAQLQESFSFTGAPPSADELGATVIEQTWDGQRSSIQARHEPAHANPAMPPVIHLVTEGEWCFDWANLGMGSALIFLDVNDPLRGRIKITR
jgi:hypothetical protein